MDYEDNLTDEDLEELLSSTEEGDDTLLSKLYTLNCELMEAILDLQEFLEDNGMTRQQFLDWKSKKKMRMYH
jgi:hypothetical protein